MAMIGQKFNSKLTLYRYLSQKGKMIIILVFTVSLILVKVFLPSIESCRLEFM